MPATFDLVIRRGNVADGTGGALRQADVAVAGGRIAAVGDNLGSGRDEIDARGHLVTPGFVDIHTHYDGQATWDSRLAPTSWHGVTTAVMGNCGVGFAPVRANDHQRLIELMEGVEDIPGGVLRDGLTWGWESFGEYLDALEKRPRDVDVGAQLPHGALRLYVMGDRGARLEMATADDISQMRRLAAEAMKAGALGFSTSRTIMHRTVTGDPTPSLRAGRDELLGIALGLKDAGSGVIELISDFDNPGLDEEFAMIRDFVAKAGRPLSLSMLQTHGAPDLWRKLLDKVEGAAKDGVPIQAQVAPRPIGILLGLQGTWHPFCKRPSFMAIAHKTLAEKCAVMRDPAFRARLLSEQPERMMFRVENFEHIYHFGDRADYEPPPASAIAAMAKAQGRNAADVAYDLLLEDEGRAFLFMPYANYVARNLDNCRTMIAHPNTVMGLGDGGAHVGFVCDASFPTYLLTHWGRDRAHGRFDLTYLVKRMTADPARAVGLHDRGVIAPGMKADLNVIDFDRLALERPTMAYDLPAGGKRLLQRAQGYAATIVAGQVTYRNGEATTALHGKLIRGPQRG